MTKSYRSTKITPDVAAKQWANQHPEAAGTLSIRSYTPAGRGGWKIKTKETLFYVLGGRVAKTIRTRDFMINKGCAIWAGAHNGVCGVCGGLFLEPAIRQYNTPDNYITEACPCCSVEHKLLEPDGTLRNGRHPQLERWTRWGTPTPRAEAAGVARVWTEYVLDIRPLQSTVAAQLAQTAGLPAERTLQAA